MAEGAAGAFICIANRTYVANPLALSKHSDFRPITREDIDAEMKAMNVGAHAESAGALKNKLILLLSTCVVM